MAVGPYLARFGFVCWLRSELQICGALTFMDAHTNHKNALGSDWALLFFSWPASWQLQNRFFRLFVCLSICAHVVVRAHALRIQKHCRLGTVSICCYELFKHMLDPRAAFGQQPLIS